MPFWTFTLQISRTKIKCSESTKVQRAVASSKQFHRLGQSEIQYIFLYNTLILKCFIFFSSQRNLHAKDIQKFSILAFTLTFVTSLPPVFPGEEEVGERKNLLLNHLTSQELFICVSGLLCPALSKIFNAWNQKYFLARMDEV